MFIINITYKVSLKEIDNYIDGHIKYLNEQYKTGSFIASGRKVPRDGGVILSNISDKKQLLEILEKDPFNVHNLADYNIIEFIPSKTSKELQFLVKN